MKSSWIKPALLSLGIMAVVGEATIAQQPKDEGKADFVTLEAGALDDIFKDPQPGAVPNVWWGGKKGSFVSHGSSDLGQAFYYYEKGNLKEHYALKFEGINWVHGRPYAIYHEMSLDGQTPYERYKWALPAFLYHPDHGLAAYHKRPGHEAHVHSYVYVTPIPTTFQMHKARDSE